MKKLLFVLVTFCSLVANAQIYTRKQVVDKFDDVVSDVNIKTLVDSDSIGITIEEKGKEPKLYKFVPGYKVMTTGSKDEIVNLIDDVYGYEETWAVIPDEKLVDCFVKRMECILEEDDKKRSAALKKVMDGYVPVRPLSYCCQP